MISWLIQQTLLVSLFIGLLVLLKPLLLKYAGSFSYYLLWSVIPLNLLLSITLPILSEPLNTEVSTYLVQAQMSIQGLDDSLLSWSQSLLVLWVCGAVSISAYVIKFHFKFLKKLTLSELEAVKHCSCRSLNLPPILRSSVVTTPIIIGFFKPRIIVPLSFNLENDHAQRLLIEHELTHHRRGDLYWNLFAFLHLLVFWFNPLIWLGYKEFRHAQELSCDASVLLNKSSELRQVYATTFLSHSILCYSSIPTALQYGAINSVKERINNMKSVNSHTFRAAPLGLFLLLFSFGFNVVNADTGKSKVSDDEPILKVAPVYPEDAKHGGVNGEVLLKYNIEIDGSVSNVSIVKASETECFNASALEALSQWKYKPNKTKRDNRKILLKFEMDNQRSRTNENNRRFLKGKMAIVR